MRGQLNENSSLSDYALSDDESLEEFAEFSPKYQVFRLFRACLSLQASQQYPRARKTFYDNLGWFSVMFDPVFPQRCFNILQQYNPIYQADNRTYEQVEQKKFMRIIFEFSVMLIDASSRNRVKINTRPDKHAELVPIGYAQVLNYEHMSLEFFNRLTQIQTQQSQKDAMKFFNHGLSWFGGIFDSKFLMQGYLIQQTDMTTEMRFRKLVGAFSKLQTRKSITPTAFASLVYKPRPNDNTPRVVGDIVKSKGAKSNNVPSAETALINAAQDVSRAQSINDIGQRLGQVQDYNPLADARAYEGDEHLPYVTTGELNNYVDGKYEDDS